MTTRQCLILAEHAGNQSPYFFDSGNAVLTEMNGATGTQSSQ